MRLGNRSGIALVAVLGALVLLSVIAAGFLTETRTEARLARNAVENAKARALADAGVRRAVLELLAARQPWRGFPAESPSALGREELERALTEYEEAEATSEPGRGWRVDGTVYAWNFAGGEVLISIQDEAGKIDLNAAPEELLRGLFAAVGVEEAEAAALADAVADFRDRDDFRRPNGAEDDDYRAAGLAWGAKDAPFELVEELEQVMGLTPELYERAAPFVTVHWGQPGIDPAVAPREVLRALPGVTEADIEALLAARADPSAEADRGAPPGRRPARALGEGPGSARLETGSPSASSAGLGGAGRYIARSRGQIYAIRAEAATEAGAAFVREAVVAVTGERNRPFRIHEWKQGARAAVDTRGPD